jgi:hypothetical protein
LLYTLLCMHTYVVEHTLFQMFVGIHCFRCLWSALWPRFPCECSSRCAAYLPVKLTSCGWWAVQPRRSFMIPALSAFVDAACTVLSAVVFQQADTLPTYLLPGGKAACSLFNPGASGLGTCAALLRPAHACKQGTAVRIFVQAVSRHKMRALAVC